MKQRPGTAATPGAAGGLRGSLGVGLARLDATVSALRLWHLIGLFCLLIAFFGTLATAGFDKLSRSVLEKEQARLDSIAELKANESDVWARNQLAAVNLLATNRLFGELLTPMRLSNMGPSTDRLVARADAQRLNSWLEHTRQLSSYLSIEVVDADGRALLNSGSPPYTAAVIKGLLASTATPTAAELLEFQVSREGVPYMLMASRLPDVQGQATLWLAFSAKSEDSFLPMIRRWPNPTRSGELLVYRRDGPRMTLLNQAPDLSGEFQHVDVSALRSPEAQALRAGDGVYQGVDQNGREVLAAVRRASAMPWHFSARISTEELTAPLRRMAWLYGLLGVLGVLVTGLLVALFWRGQRQRLSEADGLNRRLSLSNEAALAATRTKSAFLANMSHEIRTPLNAIVGLGDLLQARAVAGSWESVRLGQVQASARHLMKVITDVLDMSRIESGKLKLESIDFRIEDVLAEQVLAMTGVAARDKGLELVFDVEAALQAPLRGDPFRLGQALVNYIGNAIKFTDAGRVVVTARLCDEDAAGTLVEFEVSDTGIGLSELQMARIFDSFEQADTSITRRHGGSGLGLAITRDLASLMGGTVGVRSQVGRGSQFWFTARLQRGAPMLPLAAHGLPDARVLIVDDQPAVGQVLAAIARRLGLRPATAVDAVQAAAALRAAAASKAPFRLVMLDWRLPGCDGRDTLHQLRSAAPHQPLTVLALTTTDDLWLQEQAFPGSDLVALHKPVSARSLSDALCGLTPLSPAAPAAAPAAAPVAGRLAQPVPAQRHVLMVEDNVVNQIIGTELLAALGYEVTVAADGHEGLQRARAQRYDAVLMDMQMPVMDGLEATRRIRQLPGWAQVPIIAMTANAFAEDRGACTAAGMDDHLPKPVLAADLKEVLQRWLPPAPGHRDPHAGAALPRSRPLAPPARTPADDAAQAVAAEDFLTRTRLVHSLLASADALAFELAGELKGRVPAHLSGPLRDRIDHLLDSMEVFDAHTAALMLDQVLPDLERALR